MTLSRAGRRGDLVRAVSASAPCHFASFIRRLCYYYTSLRRGTAVYCHAASAVQPYCKNGAAVDRVLELNLDYQELPCQSISNLFLFALICASTFPSVANQRLICFANYYYFFAFTFRRPSSTSHNTQRSGLTHPPASSLPSPRRGSSRRRLRGRRARLARLAVGPQCPL